MSSILVTGATGFIGSHFLQGNNDVKRVLVRKENASLVGVEQYVLDDVINFNDPKIFDGCDTVVYLAGIAHDELRNVDDARINEVNNVSVINFAKVAAENGINQFIYLSSTIVYGLASSSFVNEETKLLPNDSAALAKAQCEKALATISDTTRMNVVILRSPLVYGMNVKGNLGTLIDLVSQLRFSPFGLVNNKRHFISVDNLVNVINRVAEPCEHNTSGVYLVSDAHPLSTKELVDELFLPKKVYHIPIPLALFKLLCINKEKLYKQLFSDYIIDSNKYNNTFGNDNYHD